MQCKNINYIVKKKGICDLGPVFFVAGRIRLFPKSRIRSRVKNNRIRQPVEDLAFKGITNHLLRGQVDHGVSILLGDPDVTTNIYCKSRNLPKTDTQNYGTDFR